MFYLAKFCRICIKTDVELIDVNTHDKDSIKLCRKLEECTKIVISKESLSTKICTQCIQKLKVSYEFHEMCKKSSKILQGILSELISDSDKLTTENFTNSELRVSLSPLKLPEDKTERRILPSDDSILKSLLSCKNISRNIDISEEQRGGLRNIIAFTRSFDFGFSENNESSISKLVQFSEGYFKRDFTAFQNTVLYIIENNKNLEDEEAMFNTVPEEIREIPFEEVIIEPDIRVKTEIFDDHETFENSCDKNDTNNVFKKEYNDMVDQDCFRNVQFENSVPLIENLGYQLECNRTFSQNSIRCRTRGNPYINPQLKKQFMLRSFQCKKCPRYFKTPGYLKAHCAKVHNVIY